MGANDSGLADIWHLDSPVLMAALSTAALAGFAGLTLSLAIRVFHRRTVA